MRIASIFLRTLCLVQGGQPQNDVIVVVVVTIVQSFLEYPDKKREKIKNIILCIYVKYITSGLLLSLYVILQWTKISRIVCTRYLKSSFQSISLTPVSKKMKVHSISHSFLFSPSDIRKKLSHHFLLHFSIGMGSYDHHTKYQGVFMDLL